MPRSTSAGGNDERPRLPDGPKLILHPQGPLDRGEVLERAAAGRHGEARRRYGIFAARMAEIGVEAAPFPSPDAAAVPA
ncbi:MAG TPA: hypothetical protein VNL94_00635 [Candidatus Binatia bacterium]|nr:hypothetical protein [Candidatus Binatia bacterium]